MTLRDASGAAAVTGGAEDAALSVSCSPDPSAPAGSSFCYIPPVIWPQGGGLYQVTLQPGTIWGAHASWPPNFNT